MCATELVKKKQMMSTPVLYAIMIGLGLLCGFSDLPSFKALGLFVSDLFIKLFQCVSLPIISLSIIVTLSQYKADFLMKNIWRRTLSYTFATTFLAASISCLLYLLIQPSTLLQTDKMLTTEHTVTQGGYLDAVAHMIPSNMLSPFLEQQVIAVLFLSIIVGIALRQIPDPESQSVLTKFFHSLHSLFIVITQWIIKLIPLGLFGFITSTVLQFRSGMPLKGIGSYLLIIVLANLIQGFIILPLWLKFHGIKPFKSMRAMLPALSVAFFSKSSVGTLPVTMTTIENNLGVKPKISRFVLPLCTSVNMNGCSAFIFTTVIYLMQNHGVNISLPMMGLWILISTLAALGNAGVPMGCFFLSVSLLSSMNIPIGLMGIILPFYGLIDMLETALNVWSDACVTQVVADKAEQQTDERPMDELLKDIEAV